MYTYSYMCACAIVLGANVDCFASLHTRPPAVARRSPLRGGRSFHGRYPSQGWGSPRTPNNVVPFG